MLLRAGHKTGSLVNAEKSPRRNTGVPEITRISDADNYFITSDGPTSVNAWASINT